MGSSDYRLYTKWQREIKKKRKKKKLEKKTENLVEAADAKAAQKNLDREKSVPSEPNSDHDKVQIVVHDSEQKMESATNKDPAPASVAHVVIVSSSALPCDDADTFLLPDLPVSAANTPRRRENACVSDSEDYGDISDAELDFSFR
jgi:hypothetical protein